jgi:hypothetical protein
LYEQFGSDLAQKLAELGLEPTDANYGKIRAQLIEALTKISPKNRTDEKMEELFREIASEVTGEKITEETETPGGEEKEMPDEPTETLVKYTRAHLVVDQSVSTLSDNFGISWADFGGLIAPGQPFCTSQYAVAAKLEEILFDVDVDIEKNEAIIKVSGFASCNEGQCYSGEYGTTTTTCSFSGTLETDDVRFEPETMDIFIDADGFVDVTCTANIFCAYDPSLEKPIWAEGQATSSNRVNFFVSRTTEYEDCVDEMSFWTNLDETEDKIFLDVTTRYLDSEKCFPLNWTFE